MPRTFQRTVYRPGELVQCDLWEPARADRVGHGQRRRGWVVTAEVCWSRAIAGALIFSKEAPDILWGLAATCTRLGALPQKLVWDRESAIAAAGVRRKRSRGFCGQLDVGWVILEARDPQAKGALERSHRFMRSNFEPGPVFANHLGLPGLQLDGWMDRVNGGCTARSVPSRPSGWPRSGLRMRPLPGGCPTSIAGR